MPTLIYLLKDPRSGDTRYVGKTCRPLSRRLRGHIAAARRGVPTRAARWIATLLSSGLEPVAEIVQVVADHEDWAAAERDWISRLRDTCDLCNLTDGGEGLHGYSPSEAQRSKLSAALKGRSKPPDHVAAAAAGRRGKPNSPEMKARMSALMKTPEMQAKLKAAHRSGRVYAVDHLRQAAAARRGKPIPAEQRQKMSASNTGRRHTPETLEKMRRAASLREAARRAKAQPLSPTAT